MAEQDNAAPPEMPWEAVLKDPVLVRMAILRGTIVIPPDLVWLHDTHGPVAGYVEALRAAEKAHQVHANCDDCMETASDPAVCEHCFKSWNEALELRQAALAGTPKAPARNTVKDKDLRDRLTRAKHYLEDEDLFGDNQRINRAVGEIVGALNKLEPRSVDSP